MAYEKREPMSEEEFISKVGEILRELDETEKKLSLFEPENIRIEPVIPE